MTMIGFDAGVADLVIALDQGIDDLDTTLGAKAPIARKLMTWKLQVARDKTSANLPLPAGSNQSRALVIST